MAQITGKFCQEGNLVDLCDDCEYALVTIGQMTVGKIYRISDLTRPIKPLTANLQETTGEVFYFRYVFMCLEEPVPYMIGLQKCYTFKSIFLGTNEISHKCFIGKTVCVQTILPSGHYSFSLSERITENVGGLDTVLVTIEDDQLIEELE